MAMTLSPFGIVTRGMRAQTKTNGLLWERAKSTFRETIFDGELHSNLLRSVTETEPSCVCLLLTMLGGNCGPEGGQLVEPDKGMPYQALSEPWGFFLHTNARHT